MPTEYKENLTLQQFKVIQGHRSWCLCNATMSNTDDNKETTH